MKSKSFKLTACVLSLVLVVVGIRIWILIPYRLRSLNMLPTIKSGDFFWIYQQAYQKSGDVARGDLIGFTANQRGESFRAFMRVVGVPGDHVKTKGGDVYINGDRLPHAHTGTVDDSDIYEEANGGRVYRIAISNKPSDKFTIPDADVVLAADAFFLMGDNRTMSYDSRFTGPIIFADIIGRKL